MNQFPVLGLIGASVLLTGLFKVRKLRASRSWARTTGTIGEASVRESFSCGDEQTADSYSYIPEIVYQFQVEGHTFRGDRISFDRKAYSKRQQAQAVAAGYPVGAPVEVFFDPAKPDQSVLVRKSGMGWVLVAAGAVTVLLAAASAIASK